LLAARLGDPNVALISYRALWVAIEDKHEGRAGPGKRRRGSNVDRKLMITDAGRDGPVEIVDHDGDDRDQFTRHARQELVAYLNQLGQDGWKVIQCDFQKSPDYFWPEDWYFMMRESDQ
jgi:hypothetical protein